VPSFFLGMDLFWWVTRIVQQEIWYFSNHFSHFLGKSILGGSQFSSYFLGVPFYQLPALAMECMWSSLQISTTSNGNYYF
jgi:hypothetical protein